MMPLPTRIAEQLAAERRAEFLHYAEAHTAASIARERRGPGLMLRQAVRRWPETFIHVRPIAAPTGRSCVESSNA